MKRPVLLSLLLLAVHFFAAAQCDNVTDPGSIAADQIVCPDNPDPAPLISVELPSGGSGELEYLWISTTIDPASPEVIWFPVPDSNSPSLDPGPISQTTYYRRCSRRAGCDTYATGESNIITVIYADDCADGCDQFKVTIENIIPADCADGAGTVSISVVAGTLPIMYDINGEVFDTFPISFAPGDYTLTATDAEGCSDTVTFTVTGTAGNLSVNGEVSNPLCSSPNGSIDLNVTGGNEPYNYLWNDGSTDGLRENLLEGTYTVTVTDAAGCTASATFTLMMLDGDVMITLNPINADCGEDNGGAEYTITGGTPPFLVKTDGVQVIDIENLPPGTYTVTVTDLNGCTDEEILVIESNGSNVAVTGDLTNPVCNEPSGAIDLTIIGATGEIMYLWNDGNTDADRQNLPAGDYTVTVTDALGCTASASFTLIMTGSDLNLTLQPQNATCGASNGGAEYTITGGTPPFIVKLDGVTVVEITNLPPGTYTVSVTDLNGCFDEEILVIEDTPNDLTAAVNVIPADCGQENGGAQIIPSGGTAPYQILINGTPAGEINILSAGDYTVVLTDANGCSVTTDFTVSQSDSTVNIAGTVSNPVCNADNGSILLTLTGGTEPIGVQWEDGSTDSDRFGLTAGTYSVTATDAVGCEATASFTLTQTVSDLSVSANIQDASCNGSTDGAFVLNINGSEMPYIITVNGAESDSQVNNLPAGEYEISVTDAFGCNFSFPIMIAQPPLLNVDAATVNPTCGQDNGSITLMLSGGTPPYTVIWTDDGSTELTRTDLAAGTYGVEVKDINNCVVTTEFTLVSNDDFEVSVSTMSAVCNAEASGTVNLSFTGGTPPYNFILDGEALSVLPEFFLGGNYQLQIFDANGCSDAVEFSVEEPEPIIYLAEITEAECPDESTVVDFLQVQGGSGNYTYLWSDGAVTDDRIFTESGQYTVTVTDSNGCTLISEIFTVNIPEEIIIDADEGDFENISCTGETDGSVDITVTGGTPPYQFFWSNGATTEDLDNLAAGNYLLQVFDANGCSEIFLAVIEEPEPLSATADVTNAQCMMNDGSAMITPAGGTDPFFYEWATGDTTQILTDLAPGMYDVTVTDFAGCQTNLTITVEEEGCLNTDGSAFGFVITEADGNLDDQSVMLHWMTEGEAEEGFFILEHSTDGVSFRDISGLLPGQGATQVINDYTDLCTDMALGTHFFRVRYVDIYGNLTESETVSAVLVPDNPTVFNLYPNPTADAVTLHFLTATDLAAEVEISNTLGGIIEQTAIPLGTLWHRVDLTRCAAGIYYVTVRKAGYRQVTRRVLKL